MKTFYLAGSIVLTVMLLILAFGNIAAQCSGMVFFFYDVQSNPTVILLGISVIGIVTGIFYHSFLQRVFNAPEDEDDVDGL